MTNHTATQDEETLARHLYAGYAPGRGHVYLDVRLTHRYSPITEGPDGTDEIGGFQTVAHERIERYTELGISALVTRGAPNGAGPDFGQSEAGQVRDALVSITRGPVRDLGLVEELNEIWRTCHLNGMKTGCIHQDVVWEDSPLGRRPSLELTKTCPQTGYRYGHAWLVEELQPEVIDRVRAIVAQLQSAQPGLRGDDPRD
jgi:hypothetical protein